MEDSPKRTQAINAVTRRLQEVDEIESDTLRDTVVDVWARALVRSEYETVDQVEFLRGHESVDESLVTHTREVTRCALSLTDTLLESRDVNIDRDAVVAGALLHDISKFHETSPDSVQTPLGEMIPHPHFAIHLLEESGLSYHIQHIVLSHTHKSGVNPTTIESRIVMLADIVAADTVFWETDGTLQLALDVEYE